MGVHTCNPNTRGAEARELQVCAQPGKFKIFILFYFLLWYWGLNQRPLHRIVSSILSIFYFAAESC